MKFDPFKRKTGSGSREPDTLIKPETAARSSEAFSSDEPIYAEEEVYDAEFSILESAEEDSLPAAADGDAGTDKNARNDSGNDGKDSGKDDGKDTGKNDGKDHTLKKAGKKAAAAGTAGLAAISLMLGSAFSNPSEVINQTSPERERPAVVVQYEAQPDDDVILEEDDEEKKKKSLKDIIRTAVYSLPLSARVLLVLPLWILGYGLIAALTALYGPVIAPLLGVIIKWLLVALVVAASVFLITKAIAPDTPLSKIFSKRNLVFILIGAAVLGAGDYIAMTAVDGYEKWRNLISCAAGFLMLAGFTARMLLKKKDRRVNPAEVR